MQQYTENYCNEITGGLYFNNNKNANVKEQRITTRQKKYKRMA